jgi:N-formylglutamate deformylase
MDEVGLVHNAGFGKLKADLNALLDELKAFVKAA